jgi:threonine dehydratase
MFNASGSLNEYLARILKARVYELAVRTPLSALDRFSHEIGASVWLKREDLQPVFSFKIRGAANKIANLQESEQEAGVITASAGNHAQGVALAAQFYNLPATIVMPCTTPSIKVDAVRSYGAQVLLHGDTYDEACAYAMTLAGETRATFIHPFDDPDVIAGQGTIAIEILQQCVRSPYAIFVPVGGGGLIAGIGAYIKAVMPDIRIIGVEPEGASSLAQSIKAGVRVALDKVDNFADGVAVREVGALTFDIARSCVDEVILVSTDEICTAVRDIFEGARAIVEPSGALALAGIRKYAQIYDVRGRDLVAIASGANVNFDRFGFIVERAEMRAGAEVLLAVTIPERPGSFLEFCQLIGQHSITEFNYRYSSEKEAQVLVGIRIRGGPAECRELLEEIAAAGLPVCDLSDNEMVKQHVRHMVGGRVHTPERELLYRFEFSEKSGALVAFLKSLAGRWSLSLFHYRNHGSAYGQVLMGMLVPENEDNSFQKFLADTGLKYQEETENPAYSYFLRSEPNVAK